MFFLKMQDDRSENLGKIRKRTAFLLTLGRNLSILKVFRSVYSKNFDRHTDHEMRDSGGVSETS